MRSVRLALSLRVALNFLCNLHGVKGNTFFFFLIIRLKKFSLSYDKKQKKW